MTLALLRVAVALALSATLGCAALHRADEQVKAFADRAFHRRDPDRVASKSAPATTKKSKAPKTQEKAKGEEPLPVVEAEQPEESSPAASAAAEALFEKGHEAMEKRDYDTACARFRESDRLDPAVGAKLNLANCEQQRGKLATSWQLFRTVLGQLPPGDDRIPIAKDRIRELEPKLPKLTFQLAPEVSASKGQDVIVKANGVTFRSASFGVPLPFDPGKHRFVVEAPGHASRTYDVEVKPAEKRVLTVQPGAKNL